MKSLLLSVVSLTALIMFVVFTPTRTQAQWNPNTYQNLEISGLLTADMQSVATSDGKTWIAFYHENSGNYDMRAQLLDADGNKQLGPDGMLVSNLTSGSATYVFNVCLDASNNLIIGFQYSSGSSMMAVVFKVSQSGTQLWGANGINLGGGLAPYPALLSTGEVVVAWNADAGNTLNIQKISTSGTLAWTTPISVMVGTSKTTRGQLIGNLGGKFTMVYQKSGVGVSTTLYAQHFDASGTALYPALQIGNQTTSAARYYSIKADGDTTYFGYYSSVGFRFNSFLQRINPTGTIPWGINGSAFNTNTASFDDYQVQTHINITPGSNYVWSVCTFCDYNQTMYGVYIQKFLKMTGARQFTDQGKVVYPVGTNSYQQAGELVLVGGTPMFMFYDVDDKIFATRLDANGNFVWPGNQVELSSTTASGMGKMRFGFTPDGPNRCAGVWTEDRGPGYKGYAQGITIGGLIGLDVTTQGSVPAVITTNAGTLQMVATIFPVTASQNVIWSVVPGTGNATISATGLVTASNNGTVYAKAVAVQDPTLKDSLLITISGQIIVNPVVTTLEATNLVPDGATLNGSVTANLYPTTVSFEWGLNTSYGNTVAGNPPVVSGYSPSAVTATLSGLTSNTTYHYRCKGVSTAGTFYGADKTFIPTCPPLSAPGIISGPANVCINATGKIYSVAPITNASSYTWSVPAGATLVSGQGTMTITVNFTSTSGTISVAGSNFCSIGTASTLPVSVNPPPVPTITGPNPACEASGFNSYSTQGGMSGYAWTISAGGTITAGTGTSQIMVTWNTPGSQSLSVNYTSTSGCAAATPTTFSVTVNPLPASAGAITGTSVVCGGATGVIYSTMPLTNAVSYVWSLPFGATIIAGANTNTITVNFNSNASSGNITVTGNNLCGNGGTSAPFPVTVNPLPAAPGAITGPTAVCKGSTAVTYSVAPIANATSYVWTVPAGVTIVSGGNTNSIIVDFTNLSVSGNITVHGNNTCGDGSTEMLSVTVNDVPVTPVISVVEYTLTSNAPAGNQWYFEGTLIPGATGQIHVATQIGWYWDVVNIDGCSSDTSNHIYIPSVGQDEREALSVTVYPIPSKGLFRVDVVNASKDYYTIQVINPLGIEIYRKVTGDQTLSTVNVIDLGRVSPGVYTLTIRNRNLNVIRKVLITD